MIAPVMNSAHLSCTNRTITIECDDHETKDCLMNLLGGEALRFECAPMEEVREMIASIIKGHCSVRVNGEHYAPRDGIDEAADAILAALAQSPANRGEAVIGGTNFCGHAMMAVLCPICTPESAGTKSEPPDWKQDQAETSRLKPFPSPAFPGAGVREIIAKIIDPEAWTIDAWNDNWRAVVAKRQAVAYTKADAILSALSDSSGAKKT